MKILGLDIIGFGPLSAKQLTFAEGMNVLHGPNEAAKTAIHAAIFAGLCGIRRGQGQPKREDKVFETRHRPWSGGPWGVSALIELADGRKIKLTQDLADKVGSKAVDVASGNDLSSEIQFDGSIDGSRWLGLNRRSFRAIACVRQAEIVAALANDDDHRDDFNALQQALQRAATSAGQRDETASAALSALNEFWRENVGQDDGRSVRRPYRRWKAEVAAREQSLEAAQSAHAHYLELLAQRDAAVAERGGRQRSVALAEAVIACAKATELEDQAARAAELQQKYPVAPAGTSADQMLADQVTQALSLWDNAPPAVSLSGRSSSELEEELRRLPERPSGELTPAQDVLDAAAELVVARELLGQYRDVSRPVPTPSLGNVPPPPLSVLPSHTWARARVPMIAVACFALAGLAAAALGSAAVAAALLVAAVAAAGVSFWFLRPTPGFPATDATTLPAREATIAGQTAYDDLTRRVEEAERGLADTLRGHGVIVEDAESAGVAFELYKVACAEREVLDRQAPQRDQLQLVLEQCRHSEEQHVTRDAAVTAVRSAVAAVGSSDDDPDAFPARLRAWQEERQAGLQTHDEAQGEWAELQQLLAGETLDAHTEQAQQSRRLADNASVGFTASELDGLDPQTAGQGLPQLRRDHQQSAEAAAARAQLTISEAAKLKSVAEAEAELDEAREMFTRVLTLDQTLKTTIEFLTEAQQRVYETIAPTLMKTLKRWLPLVAVCPTSAGPLPRYDDAYIDPRTLLVRVRLGDGEWHDADALSAGTREQTYLLLRLALAEHLEKDGEIVPLLLDEVTAQCDSTRRTALLNLLFELSAERQIILFTHDDAVLEWANANLPSGGSQSLQPLSEVAESVEPNAIYV